MKPYTPLFSIVTVTLNCAADAERTALSILAQRFDDYEYIVKDGGSSDGTVSRLRQLGVTNIVSEADGGIYPAMNRALELCRGRFICFLNAGDLFESETILTDVAAFIRENPGPVFYCGDLLTLENHPLYGRGAEGEGRFVIFPERFGKLSLFIRSVCQQTWFVDRRLYEIHPLDTTFTLNADHEFFLYWLTRDPACYRHIPFVIARYAGGGRSQSGFARLQAERGRLIERYFSPVERILFTFWLRLRQVFRVTRFYLTRRVPRD